MYIKNTRKRCMYFIWKNLTRIVVASEENLPSKSKLLHGVRQPVERLRLVFGVLLCKHQGDDLTCEQTVLKPHSQSCWLRWRLPGSPALLSTAMSTSLRSLSEPTWRSRRTSRLRFYPPDRLKPRRPTSLRTVLSEPRDPRCAASSASPAGGHSVRNWKQTPRFSCMGWI